MAIKKLNAEITAVGMYVPDKILDNKYFESIVDTSDEWITTRTGIKERRIIENGATSDLAVGAIQDLINTSDLNPEEIDIIIVATITPDFSFPSTACLVQEKIGAKNCWGFDLNAACSGFIFALQTGASFIESGKYKKVLVVGADKMTTITDYTDRRNCILFGDAASAVLLEPTEDPNLGLIDSILHVDGSGKEFLNMKAGGSALPASHETVDQRLHYIYQDGKAVYKVAVIGMAEIAYEMMKKHNLSSDDIRYLVPHQANLRIIDATAQRMGLEGDKLILSAFGAGWTWGSSYLIWSMD